MRAVVGRIHGATFAGNKVNMQAVGAPLATSRGNRKNTEEFLRKELHTSAPKKQH